jgi:streptogramin lyase
MAILCVVGAACSAGEDTSQPPSSTAPTTQSTSAPQTSSPSTSVPESTAPTSAPETSAPSSTAPTTGPPSSLADVIGMGRLDPTSGELVTAFPLDLVVGSDDTGAPGGQSVTAAGALWVINGGYGNASLLEVDPETGEQQGSVAFGETFVLRYSMTTGGGSIWIAMDVGPDQLANGDIVRIDPTSGAIVDQFKTSTNSTDVEIGAGGAWVSHQSGIVSLTDLDTRKVTKSMDVGFEADALAILEKTVWAVDGFEGKLYSIDPENAKVTDTVSLPNGANDMVAANGMLWVLDAASGTVAVVDPQAGKVVDVIQVGSVPRHIAAGAGAVWTANGGDGSVTKIDPHSRTPTNIPTGQTNGPCCISVGLGSVWIAAGSGNVS